MFLLYNIPVHAIFEMRYNGDRHVKINMSDNIQPEMDMDGISYGKVFVAAIPYLIPKVDIKVDEISYKYEDTVKIFTADEIRSGIYNKWLEEQISIWQNDPKYLRMIEERKSIQDQRTIIKDTIIRFKSRKYSKNRAELQEFIDNLSEYSRVVEGKIVSLRKELAMSKPDRDTGISAKTKKIRKELDENIDTLKRIQERIDRYRKVAFRQSFTTSQESSLPVIKQVSKEGYEEFEKNLSVILEANKECDYKLFEKLWHDSDYGPVIAATIYEGCFKDRKIEGSVPMRALMNAWISFRKRIFDIAKILEPRRKLNVPFFVQIYDYIVSSETNCYYQLMSTNFLANLYFYGNCNCQCGSFLAFVLSRMFPEKDYMTFLNFAQSHVSLLIVDTRTLQKYKFETTAITPDKFFEPIQSVDIIALMYSEQVAGLFVLAASNKKDLYPIILQMLNASGCDLDGSKINWSSAKSTNDLYGIFAILKRICKPKDLVDNKGTIEAFEKMIRGISQEDLASEWKRISSEL
jgi:hypothetical protein